MTIWNFVYSLRIYILRSSDEKLRATKSLIKLDALAVRAGPKGVPVLRKTVNGNTVYVVTWQGEERE